MTVPIRPSGLERSEPAAAEQPATQATPSPAELALIKLDRLLESLEREPARSPASGERDLTDFLTCAPPPPRPIVLPRPDTQGESAGTAGAGPIPATRRRSRRLGRKAATLALAAGGAMIGAVFALERDAPGLSEALRFVGGHAAQQPTMPPLDGAVPKRSEAPSSASGDAEAAPPAVDSTPMPVEAAAPAVGAAIESSAEATERTPSATTAVVPVAAPPPEPPPQAQSPAPEATVPPRAKETLVSAPPAAASSEAPSAGVAPSPSRSAEAEQTRPPLSAAPEPPDRPGKHAKRRKSAKRPKALQTAAATSTVTTPPAEQAAPDRSGDNPLLGAGPAKRAR